MTPSSHSRHACYRCWRAHRKCDGRRPCSRCVHTNCGKECCDKPSLTLGKRRQIALFVREITNVVNNMDERRMRSQFEILRGGVARSILSSLKRVKKVKQYGMVLPQQYGLSCSSFSEFIQTASRLPVGQLSFLDEWGRQEVNSILDDGMSSIFADSTPVTVQRLPPVAVYLCSPFDNLKKYPFHIVNNAFEKKFGWNWTETQNCGIEDVIFHPDLRRGISEILSTFKYQSARKCWDEPLKWFVRGMRVKCANGKMIVCDVEVTILRSPILCPVYSIVRYFMSSSS